MIQRGNAAGAVLVREKRSIIGPGMVRSTEMVKLELVGLLMGEDVFSMAKMIA